MSIRPDLVWHTLGKGDDPEMRVVSFTKFVAIGNFSAAHSHPICGYALVNLPSTDSHSMTFVNCCVSRVTELHLMANMPLTFDSDAVVRMAS